MASVTHHFRVDRINRRPRNWRHNRALFARHTVQQCGLANVRPTDDRNLGYLFYRQSFLVHRVDCRCHFERVVQQIVNARAVLCRNRKNLRPELVELRCLRFLPDRVHFVYGKHKRFAGSAQKTRQFLVQRRNSGLVVHHQNKQRRVFKRHPRLPENFGRNQSLVVRNNPARIHNLKSLAAPLRFSINAVACDAGLVRHNRTPRARQPIEQRGFAHIGAPDNYQRWKFFSHFKQATTASQERAASDLESSSVADESLSDRKPQLLT